MEIHETTNLTKENKYVQNATHSEFLQSVEWAKIQKESQRDVFFITVTKKGHWVCSVLVIVHSVCFGRTSFYSPRPAIPEDCFDKIVEYVLKKAQKFRALFWKIEGMKSFSETSRQLHRANPIQYPETFFINLKKTEKQLLHSMKQKTRYNIRLAQKKGVQIQWSSSENIDVFYGLLKDTAQRQNISIHRKSHYKNILTIFGEKKSALITAYYQNVPIASNLIIFYGTTSTYIHGGTKNVFKEVMSPYLLQWETMLEAKRRGCALYDMGGCAVKTGKKKAWSGITRFKSGFGGTVHAFGATADIVFNKKGYFFYKLATKCPYRLRHILRKLLHLANQPKLPHLFKHPRIKERGSNKCKNV